MESLSIEELVRRCQHAPHSDTRVFEALVGRSKQRVFAVAYRLMGDRQDAEDLAQEVFLKVYRNLHTLDEAAMFMPWITRITTNTCLDALAKQQRRPRTTPLTPTNAEGEEEEMRYADTRTPTPEETALRNEMQGCMQRALLQMDSTARAALVLRDIEDRPYQEIAETLALGLSAVKMRIHRARLQFQAVLVKVCPDMARTARTPPARTG